MRGVFFASIPENLRSAGEVVQYTFRLGEPDGPVIMAEQLDKRRFKLAGAKEIGVIGVVVEKPGEMIAGYEGDAERVVWVRKTVPLREPIQP